MKILYSYDMILIYDFDSNLMILISYAMKPNILIHCKSRPKYFGYLQQ